MKNLLEDYKRRLKAVNELLNEPKEKFGKYLHDEKRKTRLNTKASEYRSIITDLERAISNTVKLEKSYILFGEEVCRMFFDEGINKALRLVRKESVMFELFIWDENTTPADLLSAYEGWGGYAFISESEYKRFSNV